MSREKRDKEIAELESRAILSLERGQQLEPTETTSKLRVGYRLWNYPSFGEYKSWLLFLPSAHDWEFTFAREITWKRQDDIERLTNPMVGLQKGFHTSPSIEVVDAVVDIKRLNEHLRNLRKIRVPAGDFQEPFGLDGEGNGFQTFTFGGRFRMEWWCNGPEEWQEFINWFAGMREFLESHFRPWE